VAYR